MQRKERQIANVKSCWFINRRNVRIEIRERDDNLRFAKGWNSRIRNSYSSVENAGERCLHPIVGVTAVWVRSPVLSSMLIRDNQIVRSSTPRVHLVEHPARLLPIWIARVSLDVIALSYFYSSNLLNSSFIYHKVLPWNYRSIVV